MSAQDDIDKLADAITYLARSMHRSKVWEEMVRHAGVELDRPGVAILHYLAICDKEKSPCNVQYLAHQLGIEAPSVSRKIHELAQAGFLIRKPDEHDRRAVVLKPTAKGMTALERIRQAKRERLMAQLRDWSAKDRHQLIKLFYRFAHGMNQEQPL